MKLTIEIEDELHREAKDFAREHGTTVRELIESGLRRLVKDYLEQSKGVLTSPPPS